MTYKVALTPAAQKQYNKIKSINKALTNKINKAFDIISNNPFAGKFLVGELKGYHSYRVGDYRLIYEIIKKQVIVLILKIEKRGSVYRN